MHALISAILLASVWWLTSASARGAEPANAPRQVKHGSTSYLSGGKKIKVETFLPPGTERLPAVIVLYGSGGSFLGKGEMVDFAKQIAAQGTAVFLIHYFNRTGTIAARDPQIQKYTGIWAQTVHDGAVFVSGHPRVNPAAIGMYGYSLGAYLAVAEGIRNPQIDAVAELSGGIIDALKGKVTRICPVLILHGRLDQRVNVAEGERLQRAAVKVGTKPETHYYEAEGHRLSEPALADAHQRAQSFLLKHLQSRR